MSLRASSHSHQLSHSPLQLCIQLLVAGMAKLQLRLQEVQASHCQQTASLLPQRKTVEGLVANANKSFANWSIEVVAQSQEVDELQHSWQAQVESKV